MAILSKEELKRLADENNIKTMDDLDEFITQLEKEMIEAVLEGEMDTHQKKFTVSQETLE